MPSSASWPAAARQLYRVTPAPITWSLRTGPDRPGRPDHRVGLDLLAVAEGHVPGISGLDGLAAADVDTAAPQVGKCSPGGARAEAVEEPPGGLHEGDLKSGGRLAQFTGHRGERSGCLDAGGAAPATTTLIGPASWRAAACSSVLSRCLGNLIGSGSV
jgi:hypothetical protein